MDVRLSNTAPIEWLVSFNAEGTEAIASSDRRSALLTGHAAARLRAGEAVEAVLGSGAPRGSTLEPARV